MVGQLVTQWKCSFQKFCWQLSFQCGKLVLKPLFLTMRGGEGKEAILVEYWLAFASNFVVVVDPKLLSFSTLFLHWSNLIMKIFCAWKSFFFSFIEDSWVLTINILLLLVSWMQEVIFSKSFAFRFYVQNGKSIFLLFKLKTSKWTFSK